MSAIFAAASPTASHAQARPLAPLDSWNVEQDDEYCTLSRSFGQAETPVRLFVYSYGPMGGYRITVQGEQLPRNYNHAQVGRVGFGGFDALEDINVVVGRRGEEGMVSFLTHRADAGFRFGYAFSENWDKPFDVLFDPTASELSFDTPEMEPLSLQVGSMHNAIAQLGECETALLESWSLDLPELPNTGSPATLENGLEVLRAVRRPDAMLINRSNQMIQVRLVIDEAGEVEDCVLQAPNWRDRDARGVCRAFSGLGEFTPAHDTTGQPMRSLLRGHYLMLIYD